MEISSLPLLPRPLLIYDGDCGMCRSFAWWLTEKDKGNILTLVPFQQIELSESERDAAKRSVQLHLSDGDDDAPLQEARAIIRALMLAKVRGAALLRPFLIPPLIQLSNIIYRWIARNRSSIGPHLHR